MVSTSNELDSSDPAENLKLKIYDYEILKKFACKQCTAFPLTVWQKTWYKSFFPYASVDLLWKHIFCDFCFRKSLAHLFPLTYLISPHTYIHQVFISQFTRCLCLSLHLYLPGIFFFTPVYTSCVCLDARPYLTAACAGVAKYVHTIFTFHGLVPPSPWKMLVCTRYTCLTVTCIY